MDLKTAKISFIFIESIGFLFFLCRSLFENITGFDESVTPEVQVSLMHSGFSLMKSYGSIRTIEQLVDAVFKE